MTYPQYKEVVSGKIYDRISADLENPGNSIMAHPTERDRRSVPDSELSDRDKWRRV